MQWVGGADQGPPLSVFVAVRVRDSVRVSKMGGVRGTICSPPPVMVLELPPHLVHNVKMVVVMRRGGTDKRRGIVLMVC